MYRDRLKGEQILLSNGQAGPGRKVKQEQEEISFQTRLELLQVPLELPLRVEGGEGDVVVGERRAKDVQHVGPRREHQRLRLGVVGADLHLMKGIISLSLIKSSDLRSI